MTPTIPDITTEMLVGDVDLRLEFQRGVGDSDRDFLDLKAMAYAAGVLYARAHVPNSSTITRADYRVDPDAAVLRAMVEGRVEIVDEHGRPVAAISVPEDQRDVLE